MAFDSNIWLPIIYVLIIIIILVIFYFVMALSWAYKCATNLSILFNGDYKKAKCFLKGVMKDPLISSTTKANLCEFGRRLNENAYLYPSLNKTMDRFPIKNLQRQELMTILQDYINLLELTDIDQLWNHLQLCDSSMYSKDAMKKRWFSRRPSYQ